MGKPLLSASFKVSFKVGFRVYRLRGLGSAGKPLFCFQCFKSYCGLVRLRPHPGSHQLRQFYGRDRDEV